MPDLFSGIERSHKAGLRPGKRICSFPLEAFPLRGARSGPNFSGRRQATPVIFRRNWSHCIAGASVSVPRRGAAPIVTGSFPGGCSANALDVTTAEQARAPPQPLLMVAKCSVMMGGQLVSRRRLFGCSGPKSGSAGSSWRPQLTQISAAPQIMTPVLQDKPRHSTDLAELCSFILRSALFPVRS